MSMYYEVKWTLSFSNVTIEVEYQSLGYHIFTGISRLILARYKILKFFIITDLKILNAALKNFPNVFHAVKTMDLGVIVIGW